jgi:hypothetical protein
MADMVPEQPSRKQKSPWYQTVVGVATAVTAVVTAIGGILALVVSYGPWRGDDDSPGRSGSRLDGKPVSWEQVDAELSLTDGTKVTVRGASLRHCLFTRDFVELSTGQSVKFEKMRSLEVIWADSADAGGGFADVVIELTSGDELSAATDNCEFDAENEAGPFTVQMEDLERIDFDH